ncbi:HsdM family class I SAM-dependent methyltransferase [Leucobacter komagatae]|uniref:site-specific DNA-methyltransferase (adenine-specific) n=1 Tax=Leucobacter komagatae TaxID=55969 RepID=A0A0D0HUG4_9MICO|nr:N-6 DNA methylase [Leucobacter komagatae]KIP51306.1 hypothetical protein SD72_16185 [Leucobacter komagatae]
MSTNSLAAVKALRSFADKKIIPTQTGLLSWKEYANRPGRVDEESVIQPVVFPAFAKEILGWDLTVNLAAESNSDEGAPDFTPADAVTHPFVFETKGTNAGLALLGHDAQVLKYLRIGYPRIQKVVLTNMLSARIFDRDEHGALRERYTVHFKGLLSGNLAGVGNSVEAERLYEFVQEFSHRVLTREQKLERVRQAPPWNLEIANTSSAWIVTRVDGIVQLLKSEILREIQDGILGDRSVVLEDESGPILTELQGLASRIGIEESGSLSIADFTGATPSSDLGKALAQYAAHVAFFTTAKLLLVRVWEDLRMLEPMLYNGGFKKQMERFENVIGDVINHAFSKAKERYRPLFDQRNAYSWYVPNDDHYADIVYELANTYFGGIESDVLGQVYERMLERIDRKLLGVYYTPRDIIKLIWDLVDLDSLSDQAEAIERTPRILDIATGSGGFLVEAATRLRSRLAEQTASGADIDKRKWLADVSDGLNGVEYQRFAAYLAELNLIVQLGHVLASSPGLAIPSMGIISADTLSLHEPAAVFENELEPALEPLLNNGNTAARKDRIQSAEASNFLMDAAIGNPPYIGEKLASPILNATRREYPYWNNFVGPHMDYLYWFLILGVSKLREEGRFGFITTEYWMRADGAGPLRKYLGEKTTIERIILFRDFRLFPDAKGQHSLIVIGRRTSEPKRSKPKVSIYRGSGDVGAARTAILDAIRDGRSAAKVDTFTASLSPNILLGSSWAEVLLTSNERSRRQKTPEWHPNFPDCL